MAFGKGGTDTVAEVPSDPAGEDAVRRRDAEGRAGRPPQLDERLAAALAFVPDCDICADIGADHGRFSAALLLENRALHMLVADISPKALEKAQKRLRSLRLSERATFVAADGLDAIDALPVARADCVCILGMGGGTMADILRRGKEKLHGATLVLGAQTELPLLRQALCEVEYRIREERLAEASNRSYVLMRATPAMAGEPGYTGRELCLGPCLLRDRPPEWEAALLRRRRLLRYAQKAMREASLEKDWERLAEVERELVYICEALLEMK